MVRRLITAFKRQLVVRIGLTLFIVFGLVFTAFSAFNIVKATTMLEEAATLKAKAMARQGAAMTQHVFESAIRNGTLVEEDLFDQRYEEIPGTDPKQYRSRYDAFTDATLKPMQDVILKDEGVVFAAAAERSGYIPTHNSAERSKRLFNDPVGLASSRNANGELVQDYRRDNGERIADISSPIFVNGKHWGAFRVGLSKAELDRHALSLWLTMGMTGTAMVLVGSLIIGWLLRAALRPLSEMEQAVAGIAAGNLNQRIAVKGEDEVGRIATSLVHMVAALRTMVQGVRGAAGVVEGSVTRIGSSADRLSASAGAQTTVAEETSLAMEDMAGSIQQVATSAEVLAAKVEVTSSAIEQMGASARQVAANADTLGKTVDETSAAIEEMASSIRQVAMNVEDTHQVAGRATEAAHVGREAVVQTMQGMERIDRTMADIIAAIDRLGKSSAEIGTIIEVIEDIADQTNLLALNAAIEAARAGEAGRGFAVVADEVRKLAERSARATGEISDLIKGIQQESARAIASTQDGDAAIRQGSDLAEKAGRSLSDIVGSVDKVSELMSVVRLATQEQAKAASVITEAVHRMTTLSLEVTEATREEATAANQIVGAVETMHQMTREVTMATTRQRGQCTKTVEATVEILGASRETAGASQLISHEVSDVERQVEALMESIAFFKDGNASAEAILPASHMPLPAPRA
ncbi:Methyl-accepting chemotaxis protein McpB [compost metagenome]